MSMHVVSPLSPSSLLLCSHSPAPHHPPPSGTAKALKEAGVPAATVLKIKEGRPNAGDLMRNGQIQMMIITSTGDEPDVRDGKDLRRLALSMKVPIITTLAGARATAQALQGLKSGPLEQKPLQDFFPEVERLL